MMASEKIADVNKAEKQIGASDAAEKPPPTLSKFGVRHIQVVLLFFGLLLSYALRVNLSIGIVAMVDNSSNTDFEQYDWDESVRGLILSSFFWGYIITQVPAGLLAQKYGAKMQLTVAFSCCTVLTVFTPMAASVGSKCLICVRVLQGLAQGFLFPSVHSLLARWVHPSERGFLSTFTYSGTPLGTVIMLGASGVIAASSLGWPGIFYISGAFAGIWTLLWTIFGCNTPADSKIISPEERAYIETTPGSNTDSSEEKKTPWQSIFKSKPFWALLIAHCAQNWGFWTLLTEIPSYMKDVLNFDIKSNALLSALPYLIMWIICVSASVLSDYLMNRGTVSVGVGRKLFNSIGLWVPMLALIGLGYVTNENTTLAVFLLTLAVSVNATSHVGFLINHMDLTPNFAGTLIGMTNCAANVMSLLGPLFVGYIVTDAKDPSLWRIVFFVASGFYFFGNLIFVIFGSGKIQPWNALPSESVQMKTSTDTVETIDIADACKNKDR